MDNAQALLDLGVPPSQVQPALEAIAVMGCKYSCEMLRAYWHGAADASVPSSDAPDPAAVHVRALLSWVAKRPPPCLLHMAARRLALQHSPQHGAARKCQRSPDHDTPPKRVRVHASSHPSLSTVATPPAIDLSLFQNCAGAPGSLQSVLLHPRHAHLGATLCFCPGARGLLSGLSTHPSSALGLMPGMLCMFLHELRLFLGWLVQLCICCCEQQWLLQPG